MNYYCRLW